MTDQNSPLPEQQQPRAARLPNSPILIVAAIVLVAGLSGALATRAFSQGPGGFGPPFMHHQGPINASQVEEHADRMVRHLAVEVDATNEQQDKLRGIMRAAVKDVVPAAERARNVRLQARELLAAPTINRADLEKLRAEQIASADAVSKRVVQAIADAAEVLTPEQRKKLNERFPPQGGGFWHRWHRG